MKLALVSLERNEPDPPMGLAYIASYLRKYGNFDNTVIVDKEDPIKRLRKEKPDLIGVGSMTYEFPRARIIAKQIKEEFDVPTIIGGHHITLMPHHFESSGYDLAVIGEGEQTMLELVNIFERKGFNAEDLGKIKGIAFRESDKGIFTEKRPLAENLDVIPYPARDLLKMDEYYKTLRRATFKKFGIYLPMFTSIGCPYKCAFCSISVFWQKARFHSAEYVVGEMKELVEKWGADGIILYDDLFIADKKRVEKIAALLKEEGLTDRVSFHMYGRANLIDESICRTLKSMNVAITEFGLESGSERTLSYLKGGNVTVAQNRNALKLCKQFGFKTIGSFIIGCPGETEDDLKQTMSLVKDFNLDQAHVYQLTPFPGTKIWEYAKQKGFVSDSPDFDLEKIYLRKFKDEMVLTDEISPQKLKEWYELFQKEVEKKIKKTSVLSYAKHLKAKHIKYLFTKRFLKKVIRFRNMI